MKLNRLSRKSRRVEMLKLAISRGSRFGIQESYFVWLYHQLDCLCCSQLAAELSELPRIGSAEARQVRPTGVPSRDRAVSGVPLGSLPYSWPCFTGHSCISVFPCSSVRRFHFLKCRQILCALRLQILHPC